MEDFSLLRIKSLFFFPFMCHESMQQSLEMKSNDSHGAYFLMVPMSWSTKRFCDEEQWNLWVNKTKSGGNLWFNECEIQSILLFTETWAASLPKTEP